MAHLIDKDALVAEIKVRISDIEVSQKAGLIKKRNADMKITLFKSILSFIDTLEVKEADLEKEVNSYMANEMKFLSDEVGYDTLSTIAKHFFELGLKAQKGEETVIPEDKMERYMVWCQGKTSTILCNCGKTVEVTFVPYFYDEDNNDVYFASLCPECGKLIITKE